MPYKALKGGTGTHGCNVFKDGTTARPEGGELFKTICQGRRGTPLAEEKKTMFVERKMGIFLCKIKSAVRVGNSAVLHGTCTSLSLVCVVAFESVVHEQVAHATCTMHQ